MGLSFFTHPGASAGDLAVEQMVLNSDGNVGIGVTPDTWSLSAQGIIDLGAYGSVNSSSTLGTTLSFNAYYNSGWKAKNATAAMLYLQDSASHQWFTSGAVSADAAITDFSAPKMKLDASGNLLVGKTNASDTVAGGKISSSGAMVQGFDGTGAADFHDFYRGTAGSLTRVGNIRSSGTTVAYNTSSDYRLKEDDLPMTGATERVKALRPINFAWKLDGSRTDGFFAHEAQEVVPECATGTKDAMRDEEYEVTPAVEEVKDEDGNVTTEAVAAVMGTRSVPDYQGIDQSKLVPLLTATIQELIARIEALEGA
jgi:hypothetical protein